MTYKDAGHRPHARHTGETPQNLILTAPQHLTVTLDSWGPVRGLFQSIHDGLQSNWGDAPSRTVERGSCPHLVRPLQIEIPDLLNHQAGWCMLAEEEQARVEACFAGKTLQQVLERITFSFCIDGLTRAATHQEVRTRIGAGFMQHGGRDNDWRHRPWVMPETIRRACGPALPDPRPWADLRGQERADAKRKFLVDWQQGRKDCVIDWDPINELLEELYIEDGDPIDLHGAIELYLGMGRNLYAALVDAGIPWQDARRLLWMGTSTYIHADYNYVSLRGVLANRLEHIMDWEINCIMQLVLREIKMKCPPLLSKYLGSASDLAGKAMFAGLESWPPDGKYPNPYERCRECGHSKANHLYADLSHTVETCEACDREGEAHAIHPYNGVDTLPREHRPEQNPFFVLHPDSMAGGPIQWIATNGTYPEELKK